VVELAERQWGVVSRGQLEGIGLTGGGISRWIAEGRLHRVHPRVLYLRLVTPDEVESALGQGRPGSFALRAALECHRPELARTRCRLEERFVLLCERFSLTRPT